MDVSDADAIDVRSTMFAGRIEFTGTTTEAAVTAAEEALRRIKAGNITGHDKSDDSSFAFDIAESRPRQATYDIDTWQVAFEAAMENDWCEIDSREQHGELAAFVAGMYSHEKVERDEFILQAAIDAAERQFPAEGWSTEEFQEVVASYIDSRLYGPTGGGDPAYIEIHDENMDMTHRFHRIRP